MSELDNLLSSLNWLSTPELDQLIGAALDRRAEAGDHKSIHAASVFRAAEKAGRKSINDAEPLRRIEELVAAGKPRNSVVATVVAQMTTDEKKRHAIATRLRRKLKKDAQKGFCASESVASN